MAKEFVDYASIRNQMRSLDLILFRGSNIVSKAIIKIESLEDCVDAQYSHSGICIEGRHLLPCVRKEEEEWLRADGLYVFESIMSGKLNDGVLDVDGHSHLAVQLRQMDDVVKVTATEECGMSWCPLKESIRPKDDPELAAKVRTIYDRYLGLTYDVSVIDLAGATSSSTSRWIRDCSFFRWFRDVVYGITVGTERAIDGDQLPKDNKPSRWQFCSELVANIYRDIGIVPKTVEPQDVMPQDFVPKPDGKETYDADKQVPVLFERIVRLKINV